MKVSLKWLKEYIAINLPLAELAERLAMVGIEVKGMEIVGDKWENILISEIIAIDSHPDADRLRLVTVELGAEQSTVVCGAPNLRLGDKVAFARIGAKLIDGHSGKKSILKPAKIRGVVSNGMVLSEKELGISDSHEGIIVLPPEAPVGVPLVECLGDTVFDLDITPNRPDLLSVIGVAREIAALIGEKESIFEADYETKGVPIEEQVSVEIIAQDLCKRYSATLICGIQIAESPGWLKSKLLASGVRSINNVVDITNYVMLEYGQPLHAFDFEKLDDNKKIIVRRADDGEAMVSLDGVERILKGDMLVISDEKRALAIAGVMGGASTEIGNETTSILLESASFAPASIHNTSSNLHLTSESSMRFERGIRPDLTLLALKRATQLILLLAGGEAAKGIIDKYPGKEALKPITMSTERVERLLGIELSTKQIISTLTSLGFSCQSVASTSEFLVTAPYWRSDIYLEVDLIEEIARIVGYDKIPMTMLSCPLPRQDPEPSINLKKKIGQSLVGYGFQEIITYSLTSREMLERVLLEFETLKDRPLRVTNPMTADQEYLRTNLRPNLLAALAANRRYEDGPIQLFELGRVYLSRKNDLPDEPEILCGLLSSIGLKKSWAGGDRPFGFFDAKGVVESLLTRLNIIASFEEASDNGLRPGAQAEVIVAADKLGIVGELHPKVAEAFEILGTVYLFELNLTALLPYTIGHKVFQPIQRFPAVVRDIALVVDSGLSHRRVMNIINGFSLVQKVALFDIYAGKQLPAGKKSLAYRLTFQSSTHTLTDEETSIVQQQILDKLSSELGASLRS
jgi:phenylalanyl-tRNA synthetase beta chain